jgi:hypothetical protein
LVAAVAVSALLQHGATNPRAQRRGIVSLRQTFDHRRAGFAVPAAEAPLDAVLSAVVLGRCAHPESVCGCLHDHAAAAVEDRDLREALLRGISETGVPTIETEWVPPSKQSEIGATFTRIAKPTLQCMFESLN